MSARPYKCSVCQGTYIKAEHLIRHERIHTGAKPFPCTICGRSFARGDSLTRHAKVHANKTARRASTASKTVDKVEQSEAAESETSQPVISHLETSRRPQLENSQHYNIAPDIYHYATAQGTPFYHNMPANAPFYTVPEPAIDPLLSQRSAPYGNAAEQQIDPMLMGRTANLEAQQQHHGQQYLSRPEFTPNFDR